MVKFLSKALRVGLGCTLAGAAIIGQVNAQQAEELLDQPPGYALCTQYDANANVLRETEPKLVNSLAEYRAYVNQNGSAFTGRYECDLQSNQRRAGVLEGYRRAGVVPTIVRPRGGSPSQGTAVKWMANLRPEGSCAPGTLQKHSNGAPKSCIVARDAAGNQGFEVYSPVGKYGSRMVSCTAGSSISFHEHGGVANCSLYAPTTLASSGPASVKSCRGSVSIKVDGYANC